MGLVFVASLLASCAVRDAESVEPGTTVEALHARLGAPDRVVEVERDDDFTQRSCPGAKALLYYGDLDGPVGRVLSDWLDGSETVVCLDERRRVVGTYSVQY